VALAIVARAGPHPERLVAGVLGATGILSMWVSNTATAAMMLPIALALAGLAADESDQEHARRFTVAILLAIAFGANIGGIATLVGTPPNALLAGFLAETRGIEIGFGEWMLVGCPWPGCCSCSPGGCSRAACSRWAIPPCPAWMISWSRNAPPSVDCHQPSAG